MTKVSLRSHASPTLCEAVGVSCGACIAHEASRVDRMSITEARDVFALRYPSSGCKPMEYSFVRLVTSKPQSNRNDDLLVLPDLGQINAVQVFARKKTA
jgi:hypothetical protein